MSKPILIENSREMKEEVASLSPGDDKKESALGMLSRLLRLDSLGVAKEKASEKETPSESPSEPPMTYYGVFIPCELKKGPDEEALHVYKEREKALELVRRYRQARFKSFRSMQDAVAFALRGTDPDLTDNASSNLMGEKPYPFKGPIPQDMVALRKAIEAGLLAKVNDTVWDNPRYLVSSGNTPAILQEGSRYNALHVAAKAHNAEMCNLILNTVGDPQFVDLLYGGEADENTCREFASLLVDRYLNTPDKGLNETPLHFASKFSAVEVVDVLTSFPQCNKEAVNKFGQQPKDIVGLRDQENKPRAIEKIKGMLGDRYYVPVFHSEDDSRQPTIGNIFSPSTPPDVNTDPLSPRMEIRAFAGPMEASEAAQFRRKWKTPPRVKVTWTRDSIVAPAAFRLNEISKGLESVGRNLAEEMKVGWKEYWPFLDTFTDLRTPEGLQLLENYLNKEYEQACSLVLNNSGLTSLNESPEESSISHIFDMSSPIKNALSPISDLCQTFKGCSLAPNSKQSRLRDGLAIRRAQRLNIAHQDMNGDVLVASHTVSQLMCIERTCQVFAKRIADALHVSLTADFGVVEESLKSEGKHLLHTMSSYMDDDRFQAIDFSLIHYRLSQLVVSKFLQHTKDSDDIKTLVEFLDNLRELDDTIGSDEEKRTSPRYASRSRAKLEVSVHVFCIALFISELLGEDCDSNALRGPSANHEECCAVWAAARSCSCAWVRDGLERNDRRSSSFKRKQRRRSTSPHVIKALTFSEHDMDKASDLHCNSPCGDAPQSLIGINVDKCQVVPSSELISDDESEKSTAEESDDAESYRTASETDLSTREMERDDGAEDKMVDTSDHALAEAFIYGEEPSKMDRLVYEAVCATPLDPTCFPALYRWRHTVSLYSPQQRNKWLPANMSDDSLGTPIRGSLTIASPSTPAPRRPTACSSPAPRTPRATDLSAGDGSRCLSLQVSNWLRVTGPNSPRAAIANKNVEHNVSFGF